MDSFFFIVDARKFNNSKIGLHVDAASIAPHAEIAYVFAIRRHARSFIARPDQAGHSQRKYRAADGVPSLWALRVSESASKRSRECRPTTDAMQQGVLGDVAPLGVAGWSESGRRKSERNGGKPACVASERARNAKEEASVVVSIEPREDAPALTEI